MWDCGIGYSMGYGKWFLGGGIIGFAIKFLIVVAILALLYRLISQKNPKVSGNPDTKDSLEIIKARFAKGEISEQEYHRMKDVLS